MVAAIGITGRKIIYAKSSQIFVALGAFGGMLGLINFALIVGMVKAANMRICSLRVIY